MATDVAPSMTVQAAEIRLQSRATVDSNMIRLSDIADVRSVSPETQKQFGTIEIGPAPTAGSETQISFSQVRSRLLARGVDLSQLKLTGTSLVTVKRFEAPKKPKAIVKPVSYQRPLAITDRDRTNANRLLEPALEDYIHRTAPQLGNVSLEIQIPNEVAKAFSGVMQNSIVVLGVEGIGKERYRFRVSAQKSGASPQEAFLIVDVKPWPYVLAARTSLNRGAVINESDLIWKQAETTNDAFTRYDHVVGREVVRAVRVNNALSLSDLRNTPLVRRNDLVTVYVRSGAFTLRRVFKARGDGALGDTIELTNDKGQRVVAKVTAYHEAEISLNPKPVANTKGEYQLPLIDQQKTRSRPSAGQIPDAPFRPHGKTATRETTPPVTLVNHESISPVRSSGRPASNRRMSISSRTTRPSEASRVRQAIPNRGEGQR